MLLRSRIAPTPSGYLHIGNILSFVIAWIYVRKQDGILRLRIDDSDTTRSKPEYIEDIFRTLDWLGIDWDEGPQNPQEQEQIYSQALRKSRYYEVISEFVKSGKVFACSCSRKDLLVRPCNCQYKNTALDQPDTSLRIATPVEPIIVKDIKGGTLSVPLSNEMKDFVIRRRDGLPSYQVASLTDDIDYRINLIVRGNDLLGSTAAQLYLAILIGKNDFAETSFYHHPLQYDANGQKLSKSAGSLSLKTMREQGMSTHQFYSRLSELMGLHRACVSLDEVLKSDEPVLNFKI
jgi:glutamyl/glutaminyl-tRNA synthetase